MKIIRRKKLPSGREGIVIQKKKTETLGDVSKKYKVPVKDIFLISDTRVAVKK